MPDAQPQLSPAQIANTLVRTSNVLTAQAQDHAIPRPLRFMYFRYAPFLLELARQEQFCLEVARTDLANRELPVTEYLARFIPIVDRFQLPTKPPYAVRDWTILLAECRELESPILINMQKVQSENPFDLVELQLVSPVKWGHIQDEVWNVPIIEAMTVSIPERSTEKQARDRLSTVLGNRFDTFRRRIRPLAKSMIAPSFEVRLIFVFGFRPSPEDHTILSSFNIALPKSRRRESIIKEITSLLLPVLREFRSFTPGQGRPPDTTDDARWWAMSVFDGLSVPEIAEHESCGDPDAIKSEDRIEISLRRLGLKTK